MKKVILLLFIAFAFGLECMAQKGEPIKIYNENGYSIPDVKTFAMSNDPLSMNWRREFLAIINNALVSAGENFTVNENNIEWILDHVTYEQVTLPTFLNSKRIGNNIFFFEDENFTGTVGIFQYGKCRVIVFKTICLNLLKAEIPGFAPISQTNPVVPTPAPAPVPIAPVVNVNVNVNVNVHADVNFHNDVTDNRPYYHFYSAMNNNYDNNYGNSGGYGGDYNNCGGSYNNNCNYPQYHQQYHQRYQPHHQYVRNDRNRRTSGGGPGGAPGVGPRGGPGGGGGIGPHGGNPGGGGGVHGGNPGGAGGFGRSRK